MNYLAKLENAMRSRRSLLCLGLDPDPERLPVADLTAFNRAVIQATADLVCAYKPNFAFYEQLGRAGWDALDATLAAIPPDVPVIADAKRGDIGNTAAAYARACFDALGCDAVTVNPYLGRDAIEPFLAYTDRGVYLLCRTSNPGGADFQDLLVQTGGAAAEPLYQVVARRAAAWNTRGNLGLVIGATYPAELATVRGLAPDLPLLVPGIGAQGGDLAAVLTAAAGGSGPVVINVSRQILYASSGADYAERARDMAADLRGQIAALLPEGYFGTGGEEYGRGR